MPSVVDTINEALDRVGERPITSLSDGTPPANLASRMWPNTRDKVLRDHPWNFAVKRTITAPDTAAPDWGFLYQHSLPSNCLRLIEIRDLDRDQYQLESNKILTDEDTLYIRYIARITDPNEYDALFFDAVATRLAFDMCESLNQSNSKQKLLWDQYQDAIKRARSTDAVENPPSVFAEDRWIEVRY
jgi:hypothetical protein